MTTTEAFDTWWTESPENFCKAPLGSPECEMHRRTWKAAQATVQQSLIVAEALMPEPDHSLDNGTLHFYTAEQMRAMFDAATERAAKQEREECAKAIEAVGPKEGALTLVTAGFAAAIRARDEGVRG